jgi:threonine dehydratase
MSSIALQPTYENKEVLCDPSDIAAAAEEAAGRIDGFVAETPVHLSPSLSAEGAQVAVKAETQQIGGSFKDRGAGNAVLYQTEQGLSVFVTTSAGNHGRGVGRAAVECGAEAAIVLPESASREKRDGIARTGAELIIHGENFDEALVYGLDLADARGGYFVHPYADRQVIAGQATIGLELLRQNPDMTHLVLPVGGGGLLAGVAAVIKEHAQNVKIIAAQVAGNTAYVDSLKGGVALQNQPIDKHLEGIAVGNVHPMTFELAKKLVDYTVVIDTFALYQTIAAYKKEQGVLLETAGAVSPAAAGLLAHTALKEQDVRLVAIASGANAPENLAEEVDKVFLK